MVQASIPRRPSFLGCKSKFHGVRRLIPVHAVGDDPVRLHFQKKNNSFAFLLGSPHAARVFASFFSGSLDRACAAVGGDGRPSEW
jgi:hypothetical protein